MYNYKLIRILVLISDLRYLINFFWIHMDLVTKSELGGSLQPKPEKTLKFRTGGV